MRKVIMGTGILSIILLSCTPNKTYIETFPKIKQSTPVSQYLYHHNMLNKSPLYIPVGEHTGYLWTEGYEAYFEGKTTVSWQQYISRDFKDVCKKSGGKMMRIISPAEGVISNEEIDDDTLRVGDTCETTDGKTIFKVEAIYKGYRYHPIGVDASWQPVVLKIWHRDKVMGARPYSQLIPSNIEWKGKKATEVFGPDKLTSFIWKIQGYNAKHKTFVENIAYIKYFGKHPEYWDIINNFASFCKANNGDLYINGRNLDEFIKYIVEDRKLNYGATSPIITVSTYGTVFAGKYICKSPNGFTALAKQLNSKFDDFKYKIIVKNQVEPVKKVWEAKKEDLSKDKTYGDEAIDVVLKVAELKNIYVKQEGAITYLGYYNGEENGCELIAVKKKVGNKTDRILNYKVCNGNVERLPDTTIPAIPNIVKIKAKVLASACQKYGITEMNVNGFTLKCKPLRDYKKCNVEIIYLDKNRMLDGEIINVCNMNN